MLVVYIEIWPGGDERKRIPIGNMALANTTPCMERDDGTALYNVIVDGAPLRGRRVRHRRADGAWALVETAIRRHTERR